MRGDKSGKARKAQWTRPGRPVERRGDFLCENKIRTCNKKAERMRKCACIIVHICVCIHVLACVCVWNVQCASNKSILIFRCRCLPALNRLVVRSRLMLGSSKHSHCWTSPLLSSFIFSYFSYFLPWHATCLVMSPTFPLHFFFLLFHSLQPHSLSHSVFTVSPRFTWMEDAHEFMDFCTGGHSFRGRPKMISQPAVWNMSLWRNMGGTQSTRQLFCSGPFSTTEGVVHLK